MRHGETEGDARLFHDPIPAADAGDRILDEVVAQHFVERVEQRDLALDEAIASDLQHAVGGAMQAMVVIALALLEAALQARAVEHRGVGRLVGTEEVDCHRVVEVEVALDGRQVDYAGGAQARRVVGVLCLHHFAGALQDARDAGLADEHVMRLLRQHEAGRARQRIEAGFGQRAELELAVAVGEIGEHVEREPIRRAFVERAQDAGIVGITRAALEQRIGLLAPVAAEIAMQKVNHRPQVAALFDIDLEEVAQVVKRWCGGTEVPLLFDRGGLGVALRHDDPPQIRAMLAGDILPRRLPLMFAEMDPAILRRRREEDAPAVIGHLHEVEMRPAAGFDADRRAQVDVERLRTLGAHLAPPLQVVGLPVFERALQRAIACKVHIVRDRFAVADRRHGHIVPSNAFEVEMRLAALAVDLERTLVTDGVGPGEDPVLPGREAPEDA